MRLAAVTAILLGLACNPAAAQIAASMESPQCYEGVGCPHKDRIAEKQITSYSCDNLWTLRNTIFHQRGYCFTSARGKKEFSNSKCNVQAVSDLKLSAVEKDNVSTIEKMERQKRCS